MERKFVNQLWDWNFLRSIMKICEITNSRSCLKNALERG